MPSLQWYGRSWHIATDLLPLPIGIGAASHIVLVIVYGSLIGYYDMFKGCDAGDPQVATAASLLAIFAVSFISETALVIITSRGARLGTAPVSSRKFVLKREEHQARVSELCTCCQSEAHLEGQACRGLVASAYTYCEELVNAGNCSIFIMHHLILHCSQRGT